MFYKDTDAPVVLSHVTAISSSDDKENHQENGEKGPSSEQQYTISSHDSLVNTDVDEQSEFKPHHDFEVPRFVVHILEKKGFTLGPSLGSGTCGKCYQASYTGVDSHETPWAKNNFSYAIKITEKRRLCVKFRSKCFLRELRAVLSLPEHPNIVRAYDLFTVSANSKNKM